MSIRIDLLAVRRWSLNEHEGEIEFAWQGQRLCARVVLGSDAAWAGWIPGVAKHGELDLERNGAVGPAEGRGLEPRGGTQWTARGRVVRGEGRERAWLDVGLGFDFCCHLVPPLRDPGSVPAFAEGDGIAVVGELEFHED